jgi:hypothetical protein
MIVFDPRPGNRSGIRVKEGLMHVTFHTLARQQAHKHPRLKLDAPNHSLEATWDAPRFAINGANLLIWRARVEEIPGASARGR